jgi:hypothetical protein
MLQPSTARNSGNILLEDIPVQFTAVSGMPRDRRRYGTGYPIMAAVYGYGQQPYLVVSSDQAQITTVHNVEFMPLAG